MGEYRYDAFISYRHIEPDMTVARKLHGYIERYRIPRAIRRATGKTKMGRVFRDQEELPLSPDLSGDIDTALRESEWLIVICSPELLQSKWCMQEIDTFIALGKQNNIRVLTVLTRGEPGESFPPQLRYIERDGNRIEVEPLAADVRSSSLRGMLRKLRRERLRILAPMLGVAFDDLRRRARERRMRLGLAVCACAAAALTLFSLYAVRQNALIARQRDIAVHERAAAIDMNIGLLVEKSERMTADGSKTRGLQYALEAYNMGVQAGQDARFSDVFAAMEYAAYASPFEKRNTLQNAGRQARISAVAPYGDLVALTEGGPRLSVYDLLSGEMLFCHRFEQAPPVIRCAFSSDGAYLFAAAPDTAGVTAYDARSGNVLAHCPPQCNGDVSLCPAGGSRVAVHEGDILYLWDAVTQKVSMLDSVTPPDMRGALASSWDGRALACVTSDGNVALLDISTGGAAAVALDFTAYNVAISGNGQWAVAWNGGENAVIDCEKGVVAASFAVESGGNHAIAGDGNLIAIGEGHGGFAVYNASGDRLFGESYNTGNTVFSMAFTPDDQYVIASNSQINVFDASSGEKAWQYDGGALTYGFAMTEDMLILPPRTGGCEAFALPGAANVRHVQAFDEALLHQPSHMAFDALPDFEPAHYAASYIPSYNVTAMPQGIFGMADAPYAAFAYSDGYVVLYDRTTAPMQAKFILPDNTYMTLDAAFHGNLYAGGFYGGVTVFDMAAGEVKFSLNAGWMVGKLQFSPDGGYLIACDSMDSSAYIFSMESGRLLQTLAARGKTLQTAAFTADGTAAVALYTDGTAAVCELYTTRESLLDAAKGR